MYTYPPPPNLPYHRCVLSDEGALLEAILKWGRARAGRTGATRNGRCGARGHASQAWTRGALGNRPCPLRGAALNGWTRQVKGGRKPAWMASLLAPALGSQVPGSKKSPRWSVRKALLLLPRRVFRRSISPQRGDQLKAQLARRRGNAKLWLFEM